MGMRTAMVITTVTAVRIAADAILKDVDFTLETVFILTLPNITNLISRQIKNISNHSCYVKGIFFVIFLMLLETQYLPDIK